MRTYSNGTKAKKSGKNFFKKNMYAFILGGSLLIVALVITLSLTLGLKKPTIDTPVDVPPVTEKQVFISPLKECVVKHDAAFDKLVWNETLKQWRTHNGIDLAAAAGDDVYSVSDGKVTKVENTILDGVVVTVSHANGFVSVYKGLESASVEVDAEVKGGDVIGKVGNMMCEQNRGAHLHLEMLQNGKYVNAMDHINAGDDK